MCFCVRMASVWRGGGVKFHLMRASVYAEAKCVRASASAYGANELLHRLSAPSSERGCLSWGRHENLA